jgi:cellulose synthase/poly-beta-1,6-N-acetylglucosamine synthase-like glycosyltransferase
MAVCVVIPVGGLDPAFEPQLRAVLAQQLDRPFTVVLSVNTAHPAARAAVDDLVARVGDARVRTVSSAGMRSAAHARNVGLRAAPPDADLVAFCDADDLVAEGWLAALVDALGDDAAVGGHLIDEHPDPRQATWRPPATPGELPSFLGVPYIVTANMVVRRDAFEAVGGFDTSLVRCEDIAISWALLAAGHRIAYAPDAVVHYRHRAGLWPLLRQHELYGRGMAQVLARYGVPQGDGWRTGSGLSMLRPNGQRAARRSLVGTARRAALAIGRVHGIVEERLLARRRGSAKRAPSDTASSGAAR